MSTAAKDSRINELFMEGSHHRNLSVMAIDQNMYYNKDPTQTRNCHYLVLFNNPVDRQQVMILARQIYPENTLYHLEIMRDVKHFLSDGYNEQASVKMALNKNRHLLEEGWNEEDTDSEKEDTDSKEEDVDSEEDKDSQESDNEESSWTVIRTISLPFLHSVYT